MSVMSSRTLHCSTRLAVAEAQEVDVLIGDLAAGRRDAHEFTRLTAVMGDAVATRSPSPMTSWTSQRWSEKTLASHSIVRFTPSNPVARPGGDRATTTSGSDDLRERLDVAGGEDLLPASAGRWPCCVRRPSWPGPPFARLPSADTSIWCKYYSHEMTDDVKPRRAYRSTRRAEQVAQTRRDILADGRRAVPRARLRERVDAAHRAPRRESPSRRSTAPSAARPGCSAPSSTPRWPVAPREPSPGRRAAGHPGDHRGARSAATDRLVRRTQPGIHRRAGPLLRALRDAAPTDPELEALWASIEAGRLTGQAGSWGCSTERGALRPGLSVEEGRDGLWTLTSLAVFDMLVGTCGWTVERYEAWLADRLADLPAAGRVAGSNPLRATLPAMPVRILLDIPITFEVGDGTPCADDRRPGRRGRHEADPGHRLDRPRVDHRARARGRARRRTGRTGHRSRRGRGLRPGRSGRSRRGSTGCRSRSGTRWRSPAQPSSPAGASAGS